MNKKLNLQEATMLALSNQLDDGNVYEDVEGVIDDVLVVTDPEVTPEQYEEVIERAQEIVEETPEGEIPYDDDFLGQYVLTCPLCGNDFLMDHILEGGTPCPLCEETPEGFLVKGQLQQEGKAAAEAGVVPAEENMEEDNLDGDLGLEETQLEEPEMEEEEEEESPEEAWDRQTASKEIGNSNKLVEQKLEEDYEDMEDVSTEEDKEKRLNTYDKNTDVYVVKNSYGYYAKGLIVDKTNKQFQCVQGEELPWGKYKQVTLKDYNEKIQELKSYGFKEYTV